MRMVNWEFLYVEQTFRHPYSIEQTSLEKFITGLELSSISKMQNRDNDKKQPEEEKRDLELENIMGNLLIAEYKVDRLRT
jgi:hypothetical protein